VQINDHVKGFALGEQVEVIGVREGMVRVRREDGYHSNIKALPLSMPEAFSVYERKKLEICEGDRLRITCNGRSADNHRLNNKDVHSVDYISHDGKIVLENGWKLDRDFKHLDHGYALTSHAAQGKTVDWVFVAESAQLSTWASDLRQFYVSMTRGRKGSKLYVDDLELVQENVSRRRERPMATEMLQEQAEETRSMEVCAEKREAAEMNVSESLGKWGAREFAMEAKLHKGVDKALEMAYPISEQEAAETMRQMEEAECEHQREMAMEMD
jgi:hypothetical protein